MIGRSRPGHSGRQKTALYLVVGLLMTGLELLVGSSPAIASTPQPVFGMRPAAEGQTPLPGGHFTYSVPPGSTLIDAVIVQDLTNHPVALQLFGADLIPVQGGGLGATQLGEKTNSVGKWTTVQDPSVDLSPGQQAKVPFAVQVPKDALSGDYGGAIVAQNAASTGTEVAVQFRVGLQIRIHVTGQNPKLAGQVSTLSKHQAGKSMVLTTTLKNTGNETFRFDGIVHLRQGRRDLTLQLSPSKDYLFPGQEVTLTAKWPKTPIWGSARAEASVVATPARGAAATLRDKPISIRFFPWWLVLMAIVALLLLLIASVQTWRNRTELRRRLVMAWRRRRAVRQFKGQLDVGIIE